LLADLSSVSSKQSVPKNEHSCIIRIAGRCSMVHSMGHRSVDDVFQSKR
jgi:hypothetical protein